MARRSRPLGIYSQNKMAMTLASTLAARMGPMAESPLGQYLVTASALERAGEWYRKRKVANVILDLALKELGNIPPMHRAIVNALATAASKVANLANSGRHKINASEVLDDVLDQVKQTTGAPDRYVNAVKNATLQYLAQPSLIAE